MIVDASLDEDGGAVLSRDSLDRDAVSLTVVGDASDVNAVNAAVVPLRKTVDVELVLFTTAVAVLDVGTGVLLLRKTVGADGPAVAVTMREVVLKAVVLSSGLLVRSKVVDEGREGGDVRTVVLGMGPTEVAIVGTVAIPVRLASSDDVILGGATRLVAFVTEDKVPGATVKVVLIVPDVKVVVIVMVKMTGDSAAVPLMSAGVELEALEGATSALLAVVVSTEIGSGVAGIATVVFAKLGSGAADDTNPWLLDGVGDVELAHIEDSVRGDAVGRSKVVVNVRGIAEVKVGDREISVLVRLFGGLRLVMIGTGTADDVVGATPGGVAMVAFGSMTVDATEVEIPLGSALSVVRMVVAP